MEATSFDLTLQFGPPQSPPTLSLRDWGHRSAHCLPSISITTSCYPLPSICVRDPVSDWFESLAQCLHWNVRKKQSQFEEEEEEEEA